MRRRARARFAGEVVILIILFLFSRFSPPSSKTTKTTDWSRFAYVQYVTDSDYLCNSVMLFEKLHRLGSKADRLMLIPREFARQRSWVLDLILKARDEYNVRMKLIDIQHKGDDSTWSQSYTKLLAFNQTQYDRVLILDSDSTLLQPMDELFLLPPSPVAMPRAYWLSTPHQTLLTSCLVLVQPSSREFKRITSAVSSAEEKVYDMEILNTLYNRSALVIPHRPYVLMSGDFRKKCQEHEEYLGNDHEAWDPVDVLGKAKFVHFSDWPFPKPWFSSPKDLVESVQPDCVIDEMGEERNCRAREIWLDLYGEFAERRKRICGLNTWAAETIADGSLEVDESSFS